MLHFGFDSVFTLGSMQREDINTPEIFSSAIAKTSQEILMLSSDIINMHSCDSLHVGRSKSCSVSLLWDTNKELVLSFLVSQMQVESQWISSAVAYQSSEQKTGEPVPTEMCGYPLIHPMIFPWIHFLHLVFHLI